MTCEITDARICHVCKLVTADDHCPLCGRQNRLEQPVLVTGKLGFWTVPADVERQVNEQQKIFIPGNH